MKKRWSKLKLGDVCLRITDGAHHSPKTVINGQPMASVKDLTSGGVRTFTCRQISKTDFENLVRQGCQPEVGDVLIAKDGNSALDTVCEVKKKPEYVLLSSVAILRPNLAIITSSYLRYYLDCSQTRNYLKRGFTTGAAIPRVILTDFKRAEISLPPLPTQRKIAAALSAYDDLIENNTRRIKILEEMARALYREWFVDFRFPGREKVKMVDSPLGKIPEGWVVKKLGNIIELAYGKALIAENRISGSTPVYGSGGIVGWHNSALVKGPGIIVGRKGNIGSVHWSDENFYAIDTVFYVKTKICLHYMFYNLLNQQFIGTDTAVPGLNRNYAYMLPLIIPSANLRSKFQVIVNTFFQRRRNLQTQIKVLRQTRDLLLPKLISGAVDVSEIDIAVSDFE